MPATISDRCRHEAAKRVSDFCDTPEKPIYMQWKSH